MSEISFPLMSLPMELVFEILGALDAQELLQASATCQSLFQLCHDNALWKRICKRSWKLRPSTCFVRPDEWKQYYAQRRALFVEGALKWEVVIPTGDVMSKRYQHTGSVVGNQLYYIGGQEEASKRFDDVHVLDTDTLVMRKLSPKGEVHKFARHSAVTFGDKIVMFGGFDGVSQHFLLSMYNTTTNEWTAPSAGGDVPVSRTNHSSAAVGTKMYIFGGMYKQNVKGVDRLVFLNDLYCVDTAEEELKWTRVDQTGTIPAPRCGHRMLAFGNRIFLFGGGCGEQWDRKYSDVHVFDTITNTWTQPNIAGSADVCTFTVAFAIGHFMFVFGGQSLKDNNLTNAVHCLDTISMEWTKLDLGPVDKLPSQRDMASGNVVGNNMIMFGGYHGAAVDSWWTLKISERLTQYPCARMPEA